MWRLGHWLDLLNALDGADCLFVRFNESQTCSRDGLDCGEEYDEKGVEAEG